MKFKHDIIDFGVPYIVDMTHPGSDRIVITIEIPAACSYMATAAAERRFPGYVAYSVYLKK